MRRTRWSTVLACFLVTFSFTWALLELLLSRRGWVPPLTVWGAVTIVLITAIVWIAGLAVKRLRAHEPTWMTPVGAAYTAVSAQASAIAGASLGGLYTGEMVVALTAHGSPAFFDLAWRAGVCLMACMLWGAVGLLVESWCAIGQSEDDDDDKPRPGKTPDGVAPA